MTAARAVIADDERLMRDQLRARLAEAWPTLEIVAEARSGPEAIDAVREHAPDLVFLDIRMPGMTGIEAAREILQLERDDDAFAPEVVFITAYDQHAVEAFEQGAADYVLKPAERERLARTARRLQARLAARSQPQHGAPPDEAAPAAAVDAAGAMPHPMALQTLLRTLQTAVAPAGTPRPPPLRWIQAAVGSTVQLIAVDEVLFFISDEKYTRVQTPTLEALIRKPIKELLDELDPEHFWQIHRSTVVNVRAIASVTRDLRGRQIVAVRGHPQKLEVSRSFGGLFKGM
jgi:DNA-binding LytR/AlgR family response regulator